MFVTSVGTSTPERQYSQRECWEAIEASPCASRLSRRSRAILKKVLLGRNGVSHRYLALDPISEAFDLTPDALHARFLTHAPRLATEAATRALARRGLESLDIDGLIISTCTGYLCPGLTSYVSERLGLPSCAMLLDLVGQGCGAALPNLNAARALLAGGQCRRVLSVCVEVCSAAFYLDDDPGVLISACLFGDGGGAVVVEKSPPQDRSSLEWVDYETSLCAEDRDFLRFDHRGGMLRNILAPEVPEKAAGHAEAVLDRVLDRAGLSRGEIGQWVTHAGGREVLLAIARRLGLDPELFRQSWDVLEECGNLSSPFVLFVLERAMEVMPPGQWWWLNSFGAGFTSHGALLRVTNGANGNLEKRSTHAKPKD